MKIDEIVDDFLNWANFCQHASFNLALLYLKTFTEGHRLMWILGLEKKRITQNSR